MSLSAKEKLYQTLARHSFARGFTALECSRLFPLSRSVISHYLNRLCEEGRLRKEPGRPVRFFITSGQAMPEASKSDDAFSQLIGVKGSLTEAVDLCRSAVNYPGQGLPILLTGESGVGKSYLATLIHRYAVQQGIVAPERNYRDANHKPELLFALTSFKAINGFRQPEEIASLLRPLADIHPEAAAFSRRPAIGHLPLLSAALLGLTGEAQRLALRKLLNVLEGRFGEPWESIRFLARLWPNDNGLFAPLLMNLVTMRPGEAMFLPPGTPHAWLHGAGLEVMANSDNVLRAGLTAKHIDLNELLVSLRFTPVAANRLLLKPARHGRELRFPVPVDDFTFSIHFPDPQPQPLRLASAAILFCIEGESLLQNDDGELRLLPGESCFIAADEPAITFSGKGRLACAGSAIA